MSAAASSILIGDMELDPLDVAHVFAAIDRLRALAISDIPAALSASERLVAAVPVESRTRPRVLALRGHVLCYANDFAGALSVLEAAETAARAMHANEEIGQVDLARVQAYARLGKMDAAEAAARSAFEMFRSIQAHELAGKAAANLAITMRMTGRLDEALKWFDRAATLVVQPAAAAAVQSNRAEVYRDLDRYAESLAAFEQAIAGFDRCGMGHATAIVEGNVAELHARFGEMDRALELFERAHERFEKASAPADAARLLAEHGDALRSAGAHRRAARIYRKAIGTLLERGLAREAARAEMGLGVCLLALGQPDDGAAMLRSACRRATETSDGALHAECTIHLASVVGRQNAAEAADLIRSVLPELACSPLRRALALCALADVQADTKSRLGTLDEARELVEQLAILPLSIRWYAARARVLSVAGDHDAAMAAWRRAIELGERAGASISAGQVRSAFAVSLGAICAEAIGTELARGEDVSSLFELAERARSSWGGSTPGRHRDQELSRLESKLCAMYAKLGPSVWRGAESDALRADLVDAEDRVLRRLDVLRSENRVLLADARSVEDIQSKFQPGEALCMYLDDGEAFSGLGISRDRVVVVKKLVSHAEARSMIRRGRLHIESALAGRTSREGEQSRVLDTYASKLVKPILDALGADIRSLLLAPQGCLHALPLAAASVQIGIEDVRVLAGAALTRLVNEQTPGHVAVVGVADAQVPGMEREAEAIASIWSGCTRLIGADATASRVLAEVAGASVVHLACHGAYDAEFPLSSRLLLADRWVTARELASAIRPGSVIVFGGCDTARTDDIGAGAHAGLARAVLDAGAGGVVAAQWAIDDASAVDLFVRLHAGLSRAHRESSQKLPASLGRIVGGVQLEQVRSGRPWPLWAGLGAWGRIE